MLNSKVESKQSSPAASQYRKIKFAVSAVIVFILLTVIVLAAIYLPAEIKRVQELQKAKTNIIRHTYSLAVDYRDREGIAIPDKWMQGLSLTDFKYTNDNPAAVKVDGNGKLSAVEGAVIKAKAEITYTLYGNIACIIYAHVVSADGYIGSQADFAGLDDSSGTYIQTKDIVLEGGLSVANFRGKYYGNHHSISGQDIGLSAGGVFDTARSASFFGVVLTNVKGTLQADTDAAVGALVNSANYCTIQYCSVEGAFEIEAPNGITKIGGLAGYVYGTKRKVNEDINTDYINACTTKLDISVSGAGNPRVGGIVGEAYNIVICNTKVRGSLSVVANASAINKIYVGGFAGVLDKEYETVAYSVTYLDASYNLTSEADISINLTGGGAGLNNVYAGGAFGAITNQTVRNYKGTGSISVDGGAPDLIIGGVAGNAENEMSAIMTEGSIRMYIDDADVASAIRINSLGRLYAGGLVGYGIKIDIEDTVATVTPEASGDRGSILTKLSDTVGQLDA